MSPPLKIRNYIRHSSHFVRIVTCCFILQIIRVSHDMFSLLFLLLTTPTTTAGIGTGLRIILDSLKFLFVIIHDFTILHDESLVQVWIID